MDPRVKPAGDDFWLQRDHELSPILGDGLKDQAAACS